MADGEISAEQRARISQNFRAAKALLARKRPRDAFNFSNPSFGENGDFRTPVRFTNIKRVPLAEIPSNVPSPFTIKESKSTNCKYENSLCNRRISFTDHESIDCSFRTPEKQPECSGVNEPSTFCNLPGDDDNFNELILEEIDALCVQNLTKNSLGDDPNGSSHVKGQLDGKGKEEFNCDLEPITTNEILNAGAEQSSESKKIESVPDQLDDKGKGKFDCDLEPATTIEISNAGVEQSSKSKKIESASMPEEYFKYLKSLNDRQQEAACSDISIPIMIVAGPGSGKTSTMVGRVLMLLSEGIGASHTLAMTFTTAAASEMRERIGAVAGKPIAKELTISTFHSFSLQLCRSHAEKLGRTPEFLIYGHGQQRRAIIEAVRLLENGMGIQNHDSCKYGEDSGGDNFPQHLKDKSKKWQKFVTQAKASGKTPAECREMGDEIGAKVLGNYNDILRTCNALDYHDLISCSVKLLTDFPEVFNECQQSWKAIVVDEFQDTSAMQYSLLRILASHNCITIVGDDDQSIFSFNGADITGFDSFRADFPKYKEVRLNKNYRSTRCIIEAASSVIRNNLKRCRLENVFTDNSSGCKITLKECNNEDAQCAFVVDKILETGSDGLDAERSFGSVAILYRRQVTGKVFQTVFRDRRIPFNVHGVAFYRKKVVKAIMAMLRTTLPGADDCSYRQAFKALLPFDKEEKKRVIDHIDKISTMRKYGFLSAACDIFKAKISGTFKRSQLTRGRKVLFTLEMISKLAVREQSISAVITSVANMLPQKYLFEQQAVVNVDGGKLLNEDSDLRSVLQYLLDDVSDFLSTQFRTRKERTDITAEEKGCLNVIKAFTDYITERERENFRSRRLENRDSVTLTTIHQSKGLEWDTVFIVKSNESEIPLLHEFSGIARENATSIEEERRLFYVAMTRAKKKLFILFVTVDSNWQMLQPSRFLKEIPEHLRDIQAELSVNDVMAKHQVIPKETAQFAGGVIVGEQSFKADLGQRDSPYSENEEASKESKEALVAYNGNNFVRRFHVEDRGVVSHLFHQWARKQAFQEPKRLIDKVGFVIDEHLAVKKYKHKDVLRELKTCLRSEEAFRYAEYVLRWEQIPADKRAHLTREKQEHFQKQRVEKAMGSSAPTPKQIAFLRSLGCTVVPTSRLHASNLIEQYKSL